MIAGKIPRQIEELVGGKRSAKRDNDSLDPNYRRDKRLEKQHTPSREDARLVIRALERRAMGFLRRGREAPVADAGRGDCGEGPSVTS